jgi:PAS domain-containing protein
MIMNGRFATERLETEKEYQQSETASAAPQRLIQEGNWEWNLETKEYSWSGEMYRIFNLQSPQFPPRTGTFLNSVHPDDKQMVVRALGKALVGKQPYNIDHRIVWPDGAVRFVHGEAAVTFDKGGRPIRMSGTVQDLTAVRQGEETFRE